MTDNLKSGYQTLQDTIEHLTKALGNNHFCRVALARTSGDILKDVMRVRLGGYSQTYGMQAGQLLLATDEELRGVADLLTKRIQANRPEAPSAASEPVLGGRLALEGSSLLFQTDTAAICLAYAYRNTTDSTHKTPWTATLTDEGEIFIRHSAGAQAPDRAMVQTKTEDAARASLLRIAERSFRIPLSLLTKARGEPA